VGNRRPGVSQLPAQRSLQDRRQGLHDRLVGPGRPEQLPARDWGQLRQDWQARRDQIRDNWQEWRDDARENWHDWLHDHYWWHGGWYLGHAPGYWRWWDHVWDEHPVAAAIGLTWWAVNSVGYECGCDDYYNPYYVEAPGISYSEPVVTQPVASAEQAGTELPPGVSQDAINKFEQARTAFYDGKYEEALKLTDEAVRQMPRDAVLHEFRSLVLFALKRYPESAAAIHAVLAAGPGWDWKTLSSLYPHTDNYAAQLRALEEYRDQHEMAADARFLVGYHYLTMGHVDAALRAFQRAAELEPKDPVTAALIASLSPSDARPAPPAEVQTPQPVSAEQVAGTWTAQGRGSAKYSMSLRKDGTFTWAFTRLSRKEEVKGVYTVLGNVLAMEPDSGGDLLAELTIKAPDALHFRMVGAAKDDPGLNFRREQSGKSAETGKQP
jgi:tetratricopeptide (TPR) repeat protein